MGFDDGNLEKIKPIPGRMETESTMFEFETDALERADIAGISSCEELHLRYPDEDETFSQDLWISRYFNDPYPSEHRLNQYAAGQTFQSMGIGFLGSSDKRNARRRRFELHDDSMVRRRAGGRS